MSDYTGVIKKDFCFHITALKDDLIARRDKAFFWPSGLQVYCGRQGSGKTISAVYHAMSLKLRYPASILVSNVKINGLIPRTFHSKGELRRLLNTARVGVDDSITPFDSSKEYILFASVDELKIVLVEVNNNFSGVIYLIDEIHTYFNALESKNVPLFVFSEIAQQRKQRKLIIGSSQVFKRMALAFREQCDNIIFCATHFGLLTLQYVYDGDVKLDVDTGMPVVRRNHLGFFWHDRFKRNLYDTYQKVVSANEHYDNTVNFKLEK